MTDSLQTLREALPAAQRSATGSSGRVQDAVVVTDGIHLRNVHNVQVNRAVGFELVLPQRGPNEYERKALSEGRAPLELEVNRHVRLIGALLDNRLLGNGHTLILPIKPSLPGVTQRGLADVLDNMGECQLPAERLVLQMDEGRANADLQGARQLIRTFRARGFRVSISAFGSGFEGLRELVTCPPDFLRLSPELTNNVLADRAQRSVVKAICGLAHDLSISLVADQVESAEAAQLLLQMGVTLQQGSHHGADRTLRSLLGAAAG